jgi:hypothetical protein
MVDMATRGIPGIGLAPNNLEQLEWITCDSSS